MKNKKWIFTVFLIVFAVTTLSSCLILLGTTTYEVWLKNDSTAAVTSWYVVNADTDDSKDYISGNETCYYNTSLYYIPTYGEKGMSGIDGYTNYYIYLTFSGYNTIFYSDTFYLNCNKTVYAYSGYVSNRSALNGSEEKTFCLKDSDGNIYQLYELKDPVKLEELKGTILSEATR